MITIRRAVYEDIPKIMQFIDVHWKKDHILARDRNFFEWQFVDRGKVNFYIAIENGKICAIDSFILYNDLESPDMTGSIWKAVRCEDPMIGLKINEVMEQTIHPRYCVGTGFSSRTVKFHKLLGHTVIKMDHFYRLNDLPKYYIANIAYKNISIPDETYYSLERLKTPQDMQEIITDKILRSQVFYKDYHYISKRYFEHPVWTYDVWAIRNRAHESNAVIVTRTVNYKKSKCIKIVDYFGKLDEFAKLSGAFDKLMLEQNCEYIDIYSYGIPKELLKQGGFCELNGSDPNIIPNYFQPFLQKNVDIWMMKPDIDNFFMLRGDGDQDRPS